MNLLYDRNIVSFVVAESLCDVTLTLSDPLGLNNNVLDTHFFEPTKAIIKWQLRSCFTLKWFFVMRCLCLQP